MLTSTIKAYLYDEYKDDPDLPAFIDALNSAQQYYLDWFNSIGLPYYPGLSGALLDWVSEGLYGVQRQNAVLDTINASGMLDTLALNTEPLDEFTAPESITLAVSDDVLKRIITWNFFKGDGKRFCPKWLKRRIMRFLVGTNGLDPNPLSSTFTIGPEDTSAISVAAARDLLGAPTQLAPSTATTGGNIAASTTNYYVVTALNGFGETIASNEESITTGSGTATNANTISWNSVTNATSYRVYRGTTAGGENVYFAVASGTTFLDTGAAGTSGSPPAVNTAYAGSTLTVTVNGVLLSQKTQLAANILYLFKAAFLGGMLDLPVQYTYAVNIIAAVSVTIIPQSESVTGIATTLTTGAATAVALGGDGEYTYAWSWQSGGTGITINNGLAAETSFTASSMTRGTTLTGIALCTVTDNGNNTATASIPVTITNVPPVSVSLSMTSASVTGASSDETTALVSSTVTGGAGPYTYQWSWTSGGTDIAINEPTASATTFEGVGIAPASTLTGTAQLLVTDSYGQTATADVAVSVTRVSLLTASASPTSLSDVSASQPVTTASSAVTASGGQTPYTYQWSWQTGSGTDVSIDTPTAASTTFTGSGMSPGNTYGGTAQCLVTDAYGQTAAPTVSVSIDYTQLTLTVSPTSLSVSSDQASETTGTATVTASAGVAPYTYAWSFQSGGTGITINSPAADATSFTAASLSPGQTDSGTAQCTVTDSDGHQATITLSVSIARVTQPSVTVSPASLSVSGSSSTGTTGSTTATASGGVAPYSYAWAWQTGGTGIAINDPSAATTSFTASGLTPGQEDSGTAELTVTDSLGQTATATVTVAIERITQPAVTVSPTSVSYTGATVSETTTSVTAAVSGGATPYTYQWTWQSGGSGITINSPTSDATDFTAGNLSAGQTVSGTALVTVTDADGQTATATASVSIARVTTVSASVSPNSISDSDSSSDITAGTPVVTASGGSGAYTYAWSWQSGGADIAIDSPTSDSTNFTVSSATSGDTYSGTAQCVVTDGYGQTATVTVAVSITRLAPLLRTYTSGSNFYETVPEGYHDCDVELWGGAGGGQGGYQVIVSGKPFPRHGGGGGGAGYVQSSFAVTGGDQFLISSIGSGGAGGAAGASAGTDGEPGTATSVTFVGDSTVMNAGGGGGGTLSGGTGGTASGGTVANDDGGAGGTGDTGTGVGGTTTNGTNANDPATYGVGGNGGYGDTNNGAAGAGGFVSFYYT